MKKIQLKLNKKPKVHITAENIGFKGSTGTQIILPVKGKGSYKRHKKHKGGENY